MEDKLTLYKNELPQILSTQWKTEFAAVFLYGLFFPG